MEYRGAWCAAVYGVTKSWKWLCDWTTRGLTYHRSHYFCGSKIRYDLGWFFAPRSHQAAGNLSVNQAAFSPLDLAKEESTSRGIQIIEKFRVFLQAVDPDRASVPGLIPHSLPCNIHHKQFTKEQLVSQGPVRKQERLPGEFGLNLIFLNFLIIIFPCNG